MRPFPVIALFCEDIREEKTGLRTLIGVLPDNVIAGSVPGLLPKLFCYFHIHLDLESDVRQIKARIKFPGGPILEAANFDELIEATKAEAKAQGTPFAGLMAHIGVVPAPIQQLGRIEAFVEVDGTEYLCGTLNLIQPATASIASAPPFGQSPRASAD